MTTAGLLIVLATFSSYAPMLERTEPTSLISPMEVPRVELWPELQVHGSFDAGPPRVIWVKRESHASPASVRGSWLYRAAGKALYFTAGADLASTEAGLRAGAREANPLLQNQAARIALSVGLPIAVNWGTEVIRKHGHRRIALAIRIAWNVALAYVAVQNVGLIS